MFGRVAEQITGLTTAIGVQGVAQVIKKFKGDPKEYKDWVKAIEKYVLMSQIHRDRTKIVAFQSSEGPVSDFIQRYLTDNPAHNWDQLKAELRARFSEVTDPQHALYLLKHVKQNKDENVQVFAERLLTLATDAYEGQDGGLGAADMQLVGFFVDGLAHDFLKMKVMRENPATFQGAVSAAMKEQNLRKRFNLRTNYDEDRRAFPRQSSMAYQGGPRAPPRREEPMEIDHLRPSKKHCERCGHQGHQARDCRARWPSVNEVNTQSGHMNDERLCWVCNSPQHIKKDCPERQKARRGRVNMPRLN